jgi:hypothetical protein
MLLIVGVARGESNVTPEPALRVSQTEMGITQLPNEKLDWFLDAKFGMFIHWGLYSGPARGEWVREHEAIPPEKYRQYAFPEVVARPAVAPRRLEIALVQPLVEGRADHFMG